MRQSERVIVVGAGLAGLAVADRLSAHGREVTLLEASGSAGGRLKREDLAGSAFDPAFHVLPASAPEFCAWVGELGLGERVTRQPLDRVGLLGANGPVSLQTREAMGWHPFRAARLRRLQNVVTWLGSRLDPQAPDLATRLDDRSVADLCQVYLGRRRVCERFFAPMLEACFGLDASDTSRQLLFSLLRPDTSVGLSLAFGCGAIAETLAGRAADLRTDARVVSVRGDGSGVRLESGKDMRADAVVLATPATESAKLFPDPSPAERDALEQSRSQPALHLAVLADGRVARTAMSWIPAAEGGELAGLICLPSPHADASLSLLIARPSLFERHGHRPDEELAGHLLESAERLQPGIRRNRRTQKLLRFEQLVPRFGIGRFRQIARLYTEAAKRPERRVFLCGDYLVAPHVEGMLASARRAADQVLAA